MSLRYIKKKKKKCSIGKIIQVQSIHLFRNGWGDV